MANAEKIIIILLSLAIFGTGYSTLVAWLILTGRARGYMPFLVAGGVLITLIGAGFLIGWLQALLVLACFAASGLPITLGSTLHFMDERNEDEQAAREEVEEVISQLWPNAK